jgi:hypothetical protein
MTFLDPSDADLYESDDPYPALLFELYPIPPAPATRRQVLDVMLLSEAARGVGADDTRRPPLPCMTVTFQAELKRIARSFTALRRWIAYQ